MWVRQFISTFIWTEDVEGFELLLSDVCEGMRGRTFFLAYASRYNAVGGWMLKMVVFTVRPNGTYQQHDFYRLRT